MTRARFLSSLFLAPIAAVVGKPAKKLDDLCLCVPHGTPYRAGDEIWGRNLGYKPGDQFRLNGKPYVVVNAETYFSVPIYCGWMGVA